MCCRVQPFFGKCFYSTLLQFTQLYAVHSGGYMVCQESKVYSTLNSLEGCTRRYIRTYLTMGPGYIKISDIGTEEVGIRLRH